MSRLYSMNFNWFLFEKSNPLYLSKQLLKGVLTIFDHSCNDTLIDNQRLVLIRIMIELKMLWMNIYTIVLHATFMTHNNKLTA